MDIDWEKIIKVGGEGGVISLKGGRQENGKWIFSTKTNESMLDEEMATERSIPQEKPRTEAIKLIPTNRSSNWRIVDNWTDAIELLDEFPWRRLTPLEVHSDFKEKVWEEIEKGNVPSHRILKWEKICTP